MSMDSRPLVKITKGMERPSPKKHQEKIPMRRAGNCDHVIERHGQIGDDHDLYRMEKSCRLLFFTAWKSLHEELDRYPEQCYPAGQLDEGDSEDLRDNEGKHDSKHHRCSGANNEPFSPEVRRQRSDRHGDQDRIISREDQIYYYDIEQVPQESPRESHWSKVQDRCSF